MKISFQGTIRIKNGRIGHLSEEPGFVRVINEKESYYYSNSFALPGFTDSHGHLASLGSKLNGLDLYKCVSAEQCAVLGREYNKLRGDWLVGLGWNQELWDNNLFPDKKILDDYFPDIPVFFLRVDGHAAWVNTKALKFAKINKHTVNPTGGIIERAKNGEATGILLDDAIEIVKKIIPKYSSAQVRENLVAAFDELIKFGITSVHDMDVNPELISIFKGLDDENKIPLRIFSFIGGHQNEWLKHNVHPENGKMFNIVGVKFYADGSLGSRTAAMLKDYSDEPGNKGIFLTKGNVLKNRIKKVLSMEMSVATHAIGDAANRMVLNVYKEILNEKNYSGKAKLRLEHAQHIHPDDLKIFNENPVIASVQPVHCISDAATISEKRLGDRCKYAYPWKSLIKNGALMISGSDFPIETHNPWLGIDALTRRIPLGKQKSWFEKETLEVDEALNSYTKLPPLAIPSGNLNGKIEKEYLADLVIIDKEPINMKDFSQINILSTIVNGERIF